MGKTKIKPGSRPATPLPKTFRDLVCEHVPALIHDDIAHQNALDMLDRVSQAPRPLSPEQITYGKLLAHLVQEYEETLHPPVKVSGADLLQSMMEEHDLTGADIARLLGVTRGLVSHILKGNRHLTWEHAKTLGERFALKPEMFMEK